MPSTSANAIVGRKLRSLDGLRAIAIILVFLHHVRGQIPVVNRFTFYLSTYAAQGWMGVDLFFVLSGFLITGILLDTRQASNYFRGFYARRVLRIFPLYYAVLTTILVGAGILNSPEITTQLPLAQDRWLYFCYLANWIGLWKGQLGASLIAHFWSLAVEEQFYLVWPLVVWLVRPRSLLWVAASLAAFAALARLAWVAHSGAQVAIAWATTSRLDELFAGAVGACFFRVPERMLIIRKWLPWIAGLGIGSFFLAFSTILFFPERTTIFFYGHSPVQHTLDDAVLLFMECGGYILLAVGFGALVLFTAHTQSENSWVHRFLGSRLLVPIGTYSYGIYVFHVPLLGLAAMFAYPRLMAGVRSVAEAAMVSVSFVVVLAAVTFAVSAISYECFEKRILRLKRHFEPK